MNSSEIITLEPFEKADIARLISWIPSAKFLLQWAGPGYCFPLTEDQILAHLYGPSVLKRKTIVLKAISSLSLEVIGHGEILGIDLDQQSAVLGRILIGPESYRGQGYGLHLVQALTRYAFDHFPIHRLALNVFSDNTSAIHCYENAGFVREGELRDARYFDGDFISVTIMSILKSEFDRIRSRLENIEK
ncbi:MAG: GNAT family N-acetyltransferase [Fidelibacterota bacterium]